jgi:3-deoxy-D-manno-octulosonic-acid transferase
VGVLPERLSITGSLKWDTAQIADRIDGADKLADTLGIERGKPLWVCGSTGPGEESMILEAYKRVREADPHVTLAIVPRKPERFGQVADLIRQAGFDCVRRSEHPDAAPGAATRGDRPASPSGSTPRVILGDTMGELRKLYSLADAVFVGRSLVPLGGSDPMEVAALAKPVVVGPYMDNFQTPVARLKAVDAIRIVRSPNELADEIARICGDAPCVARLGNAARRVVQDNQGATARTADALIALCRQGHDTVSPSLGEGDDSRLSRQTNTL